MNQAEFFSIMEGMEQVNRKMGEDIEKAAPMCHFRKMSLEQSDSIEGCCESWWECSVCGHTKGI